MNEPTIQELKDASKQASENAISCKELVDSGVDPDGYFQSFFNYHSLAEKTLTR